MIKRWHVKNFKSILDQDLELAPLTILCGVNSSGKSSFLQTIGMLAQRKTTEGEEKNLFNINNGQVKLGKVDDIFCNRAEELEHGVKKIAFRGETKAEEEFKSNQILIDFLLNINSDEKIRYGLDISYLFHFPDESLPNEIPRESLPYINLEYIIENNVVKSYYYEHSNNGLSGVGIDEDSIKEIKECRTFDKYLKYADIRFDEPIILKDDTGFLPKKMKIFASFKHEYIMKFSEIIIKIPENELTQDNANKYAAEVVDDVIIDKELFDEIFYSFIRRNWVVIEKELKIFDIFEKYRTGKNIIIPSTYKFNLSTWFYELSKQPEKIKYNIIETIKKKLLKKKEKIEIVKDFIVDLPKNLKKAQKYLNEYFTLNNCYSEETKYIPRVEYLDPLRKLPSEYSPILIHEAKINDIEVINYYSPEFIKEEKKEIMEAMREWLVHIGIFCKNDRFKTLTNKETGKPDLYIVIDNFKYLLSQVGTGVSQVIPILEKCLLSPPNSTIVISEPEAHLHPKMQSRLADFFIAMALSDRQCLIETHSEYLIKKIRQRIVTFPENIKLYKKTKLYFVEKQNGISSFKDMNFDEYAAPSQWPEGFFDESHILANETLDALINKMKLRVKNE